MEYIFGTKKKVEILKTKGEYHTNLIGFQQIIREYPDQIITDSFRIVKHYNSTEDVENNCYDWYEIDCHNRYTDKFTPAKPKIDADIGASQDAICELDELSDERLNGLEDAACEIDESSDERISALEDAICELDELINGGTNNE